MTKTMIALAALLAAVGPSYAASGVAEDREAFFAAQRGTTYESRMSETGTTGSVTTAPGYRGNVVTRSEPTDLREYQLFNPSR